MYEIGQELESNPENAGKLASEVDEIVDDLFKQVQLERRTSFGRFLLPQKSEDSEDDLDDLELPDAPDVDDQLALPPAEEDSDAQSGPS